MLKLRIKVIKKLIKEQKGVVIPLVLVLLFLGILVVVPVLAFNSTTLKVTHLDEERMTLLYAADAGVKDAIWKLKYNPTDSNIPVAEDTAGPLYTENIPATVDNSYVQIYAETLGGTVKTYGIFSTSTKDGKFIGVESYLTKIPVFWAHAATSQGTITIKPGAVIDGDVMGTVDNKGTITGDISDPYEGNWPNYEELRKFYKAQIPGYDAGPPEVLPPSIGATININGTSASPTNIQAGYREGNLTLESSANGNSARLTGTLYINGTLDMQNDKSFTLDLNGNTIYATGQIKLFSSCTIKGTGAIISDYSGNGDAIDFQPSIYSGSTDQFIFLMAVRDSTFLHPGNTFYGAIAGDVSVELFNGCYLKQTTPNIPINYPPDEGFGDIDWYVKTWETYNTFRINNPAMPDAVKDMPYNTSGVTLCASGGSPIPAATSYFTWELLSGSLPDGLILNGNKIEGTPTTADPSTPYEFTVQATDALGNIATKTFRITVYENLIPTINSISPSEIPTGTDDFTLTVNGTDFMADSLIVLQDELNNVTEIDTTEFITTTQLKATIPGSYRNALHNYSVTVKNPGGATSNAKDFRIYVENTPITKKPNDNDAYTTGFTYVDTTLWQAVSDGSPLNSSTYIMTPVSNTGGRATFNFSSFGIITPPGDEIKISNVTVYYYGRSTGNTNCNCASAIKVGGNYYTDAGQAPPKSSDPITLFSHSYTNNPKTNLPWTLAEVNGTDINNPLQAFGVSGVDFNPQVNFYEVYIVVTYRTYLAP